MRGAEPETSRSWWIANRFEKRPRKRKKRCSGMTDGVQGCSTLSCNSQLRRSKDVDLVFLVPTRRYNKAAKFQG